MTFVIKYKKTGKEIEIGNKRAYIIFSYIRELEPLGWIGTDLMED